MARARSSGMNWSGATQGLGQGMMAAGAQLRKPGQANSPAPSTPNPSSSLQDFLPTMGGGLMSFIDPSMIGGGGAQQLIQYLMKQWQDDDQLAE